MMLVERGVYRLRIEEVDVQISQKDFEVNFDVDTLILQAAIASIFVRYEVDVPKVTVEPDHSLRRNVTIIHFTGRLREETR